MTLTQEDCRRRVWRHNGLQGHVAMSKAFLRNVIASDSATPEAKVLAGALYDKMCELQQELVKRVDPPGAEIGKSK